MICECTIRMIGEYDILVLSPQMIAHLIENIKISDSKELVISAEELLPQGYLEYLARVVETNLDIHQDNEVYKIIAGQIDRLKINGQKCFDKVEFTTESDDIHFMLDTNDYFFMLVKENPSGFSYVYKELNETIYLNDADMKIIIEAAQKDAGKNIVKDQPQAGANLDLKI